MTVTSQVGRKLARRRARKVSEEAALLLMQHANRPKTGTELVQRLQQSGAIGAWADRQDIGDSSEYARNLREQAQNRVRG